MTAIWLKLLHHHEDIVPGHFTLLFQSRLGKNFHNLVSLVQVIVFSKRHKITCLEPFSDFWCLYVSPFLHLFCRSSYFFPENYISVVLFKASEYLPTHLELIVACSSIPSSRQRFSLAAPARYHLGLQHLASIGTSHVASRVNYHSH